MTFEETEPWEVGAVVQDAQTAHSFSSGPPGALCPATKSLERLPPHTHLLREIKLIPYSFLIFFQFYLISSTETGCRLNIDEQRLEMWHIIVPGATKPVGMWWVKQIWRAGVETLPPHMLHMLHYCFYGQLCSKFQSTDLKEIFWNAGTWPKNNHHCKLKECLGFHFSFSFHLNVCRRTQSLFSLSCGASMKS